MASSNPTNSVDSDFRRQLQQLKSARAIIAIATTNQQLPISTVVAMDVPAAYHGTYRCASTAAIFASLIIYGSFELAAQIDSHSRSSSYTRQFALDLSPFRLDTSAGRLLLLH